MRGPEARQQLRRRIYTFILLLGLCLGGFAVLSRGGGAGMEAVRQPAAGQPAAPPAPPAQESFSDLGIVRLSPWNGDPEMAVGIPFDGDEEMPIGGGDEAGPPLPAAVQVRADQR